MRRIAVIAALILSTAVLSYAGQQPAPQTARQALLEMFFGKPGMFEKHLPEATRAAMRQADPGSSAGALQQFSLLGSQLTARGQQLQTFEAGPTLLVAEDPQNHSKLEITVERDDLRAEEDEIELSFRAYKDGETQTMGLLPRFSFTMKQEAGTWRLNEITLAIRVPLADPEFLKAMTTRPKTAPAATLATQANEGSIVNAMRAIITAEATYASTYRQHGYACYLSDLDGFGGGGPNEHQAMLLESGLASGRKYRYSFILTNCSGLPASTFRLTAVPTQAGTGLRAYCSDQAGGIRYADDGIPASCWTAGKPLQ
jgi:hypothetical protein